MLDEKRVQLEQDYQLCERIIKKHSKSFYFAFSKLPREKARAVYAIYAFCRQADDSIDEASSVLEQEEALNRMEKELQLFEIYQEPNEPLWRALRDTFENFDLSIQPFYDQLIGQRMDYVFRQPETIKELEEYSYYVAGSVGLMLLPIIATKKHSALEYPAISLGIAMQITNILRDIGEDYQQKNRIYLPKSLMREYNYSEEKLKLEIMDPSFIILWEKLAQRAENYYSEFRESIHLFDKDSQFQVLLASKVYEAILNSVRKNNYDCFSKKNKTTLYRKLCLFRRTLFELKTIRFIFN